MKMWRAEMLGVLFCGFITIGLIAVIKRKLWSRAATDRRFPPGPFAWPVIGHLGLFSNLPHQALREVSQRYGPIFGLRLGQQRAVVVCSPELAREVLLTNDKVFADRPPRQFNSLLSLGSNNGIIFGHHGPQWRKHRKIATLQLFTVKRVHELQDLRQQEVSALLRSIHDQSCGGTRPVDLGSCMSQMSCRIVMSLLQSRATTQVGDENLPQLVKDQEQQLAPTIGDLIPSLSWLDFFRKRRIRRLHDRIEKVYSQILMERKESTSTTTSADSGHLHQYDDLLNALLSQEEPLTMVDIKSVLHDLIGAGIHTTALTLEWAMAELLRNPHCLSRLQTEIDQHLGGQKRQVSPADLPSLSYLKCVVKEATRLHPVVPLLVPHISTQECKLQDYIIPAKTLVFVNVWAIGRDERVWPNATTFVPDRFQGKDMDLRGQHFELLPFGSGRRSCLALPLALPVLELTLANLVACFDWELPAGETPASINMDEKTGFTANKATPLMAIPKPRLSLANIPDTSM